MLSNCENTTSQYYFMYGAGAVFFLRLRQKVPKSRLRLHNAVGTVRTGIYVILNVEHQQYLDKIFVIFNEVR